MPFLLIQGHWSRFSANSANDIKVRVTRIVQFWCRPAHLLFIFCFLSRFLESNMNKKQQNARLPSGSQCCIVSLLQWPRNCLCFEKTRIVPLFRRKSYLVKWSVQDSVLTPQMFLWSPLWQGDVFGIPICQWMGVLSRTNRSCGSHYSLLLSCTETGAVPLPLISRDVSINHSIQQTA